MSEIIEGRNPVIEALRAGRPIIRILLDRGVRDQGAVAEILRLGKVAGIPIDFVERHVIERQSTTASQGVVAYAASKEYADLSDLADISKKKGEPPLYYILDGIEDPHNLGAILRTADAAGVHAVIIRSRREVGLTAAVAKASAGAVEYVPVVRVPNIAQAMETLRKNDVWLVGVDTTGKTDYGQVDFRLPSAIVIGGEGGGLSDLVRKRCDVVASIPMKGKVGSLNASVAAAIVMYEVLRQRSKGQIPSTNT